MSRHSRNNTASAVFTYHERRKTEGYGSLQERLGEDSLRTFEQCNLCLSVAKRPVATPEGIVYCKPCLVLNFEEQRKRWKKAKLKAAHSQGCESKAEPSAIEAFERAQDCFGMVRASPSTVNRKRDRTEGDLLANSDEEEEVQAILERQKEALAGKKRKIVTKEAPEMVSFWAPVDQSRLEAAQTLAAGPSAEPPPPEKFIARCPVTNNTLRLKDLIPINPDEETQLGKTRWLCSESYKELSHHPSLLIVNTGKLVLEEVHKTLPRSEEEGRVIRMQSGQTAFSKHNVVESKVFRPAFS